MATTRKPKTTRKAAAADGCNVPGCDDPSEWRGLCSAHRQTHRGLAHPKPGPAPAPANDHQEEESGV